MRKFNPHKNIFYYYSGSFNNSDHTYDTQIENNTTKAFINFLSHSDKKFLSSFLNHLSLEFSNSSSYLFDLQVSVLTSIFDAEIKIGGSVSIYIESKVAAPLDLVQIKKHLNNLNYNYLLVITPNSNHKTLLAKFNDKRLRFITWQNIYSFFYKISSQEEFLLIQFLEYLELINMSEFNGFTLGDFEAFLYIDQDPNRELRLRVKSKLEQYLKSLKQNNDSFLDKFTVDVGNVKQDYMGVWGVLCTPPIKDKVHKPHFTFALDSNNFKIFLQIEGKTPAHKMLKQIKSDPNKFLNICRNLDGYFFHIIERKELGIRNFEHKRLGIISLGKRFTMNDVKYIINKSEVLPLVEFSCRKVFARDDPKISNANFLKESRKVIDQMRPLYEFACNI